MGGEAKSVPARNGRNPAVGRVKSVLRTGEIDSDESVEWRADLSRQSFSGGGWIRMKCAGAHGEERPAAWMEAYIRYFLNLSFVNC